MLLNKKIEYIGEFYEDLEEYHLYMCEGNNGSVEYKIQDGSLLTESYLLYLLVSPWSEIEITEEESGKVCWHSSVYDDLGITLVADNYEELLKKVLNLFEKVTHMNMEIKALEGIVPQGQTSSHICNMYKEGVFYKLRELKSDKFSYLFAYNTDYIEPSFWVSELLGFRRLVEKNENGVITYYIDLNTICLCDIECNNVFVLVRHLLKMYMSSLGDVLHSTFVSIQRV